MGAFSSIFDLLELFSNSDYSNSNSKPNVRNSPTVYSAEKATAQMAEEIKRLVNNGEKIEAVKLVKSRTNWDLQTCMRYVENISSAPASISSPNAHQEKHTHTMRSRQTAIDKILEDQRASEGGGGGKGLFDFLFGKFKQ